MTWDERARAYWEYSGVPNQLELLKYVLSAAGVSGLTPDDPQPNLEAGYYYPGEPRGRVFATWREFDDWRARAGRMRPDAPRIAVGFYGADYDSGNTALVDAVVAEIERQGAEAVPVFGCPAAQAFETLLVDDAGQARVDVAMAFLFRFAGPDAGLSLAKLDVPVLSLISLYGRGEQEWRESEMGLSLFEGTFQVVSPELAGLVAPTVVGSQEQTVDPITGLTIVARRPITSRVATAVRRALRYAALAATPNARKRLALLYYNYPPGKADIGASYLNVAESLSNVLARLRDEGYDLGGDVDLSAGALLEKMLDGGRNVGSYAPGELDAMLDGRDAVLIGMDEYRRWLDALAPELRAKMVADWGPPEASDVMTAGYGNGFWGEPMEDVFRLTLSGVEKVVHSSSTMLYGALDNDDFFMYAGGLAAAVRSLDGESPELVVRGRRLRREQRAADGRRAGTAGVGTASSGRGLPDGDDGERVLGGTADGGSARAVVGRRRRRRARACVAAPLVAAAALACTPLGGGASCRGSSRQSSRINARGT